MARGCLIPGFAALAACSAPPEAVSPGPGPVRYDGIETRLLEDDLVNIFVSMRGAEGQSDVVDYARCAAAQYALIRGFGFARHVRTRVYAEASQWRGDAVYTVSPALPRGLQTIDAEVTVADCQERGIPTV